MRSRPHVESVEEPAASDMHFNLPGHHRKRHSFLRPHLEALFDGVVQRSLRCKMMRRQNDARRCFGLTGQVTPIHSPALADLVGRVPGAPPE